MAGRPLYRAMVAELMRRAAQEIGDDATVLDYGVSWIESGRTITQLADSISISIGLPLSRSQVSKYLNSCEPGASERLLLARETGADALVEEAVDLLDVMPENRDAIAKAGKRADIRTWLAGKWNRAQYGENKQLNVDISIAGLHLDALRARPNTPLIADPNIVDAEVIEEPRDSESAGRISPTAETAST
jgi:hypothetical protein